MNAKNESKALSEVLEWKAECAREVAGLTVRDAVRKRLKDAAETAKRFGFPAGGREMNLAVNVAEAGAAYGTEQKPEERDASV